MVSGQSNRDRVVVAAFDVDGTLTRGESLLRFLRFYLGFAGLVRSAVGTGARLLAPPWRVGREAGKVALLHQALGGRSEAEAKAAGARFAGWMISERLHSDAAQVLRAHQRAGHLTVLISASPSTYITALGNLLGVDGAFGTELEVDDTGTYTGRLHGPNVRGQHKVVVLEAWLRSKDLDVDRITLFAYGDSSGDDELLRMAGAHANDRRVLAEFSSALVDSQTGDRT